MRVKLISINKNNPYCYNIAMMTQIEEGVCKNTEVEIADTLPDIVHVFGPWCLKSEREIREWAKLKVPVIFTSTDGILSLIHSQTHRPNTIRKIVTDSTTICVSGPKEQNILHSQFGATHIQIIANPYVTSTLTGKEFANKICETYKKQIEHFDQSIRKGIQKQVDKLKEKDVTIRKICTILLYAQYQVHRKDLRKPVIDELVQALTTEQYDEDRVCKDLKSLDLYHFAQRIMSVAQQCTTLTEGFMPVPALDDNKTSHITNILSDISTPDNKS